MSPKSSANVFFLDPKWMKHVHVNVSEDTHLSKTVKFYIFRKEGDVKIVSLRGQGSSTKGNGSGLCVCVIF